MWVLTRLEEEIVERWEKKYIFCRGDQNITMVIKTILAV